MWFSGFRARALVLGFVAASWPAAAGARDLVYRAPAGCPSQADVAAGLEARAPAGRDARIDVSAAKGGFRGDVVLGEGERRLARSVEARTCAAVVEALALVVALDRDDDAHGDDEGRAGAPPAAPPADLEGPGAAAATPAPDAPPPVSPAPPASTTTQIVAGIGASGTTFANGAVLFATPVFVELDFVAPWVHALRASFVRSFPATTSDVIVRPELRVTAGALDYCPISAVTRRRGREAPTFLLTACAHSELGVLDAAGVGDPQSERSRVWANTGAIVRTRVGTGGTGIRPYLELSGGLLAPLVREHFHFAASTSRSSAAVDVSGSPSDVTVTAPPVLWTLALGAGLVLW